LKKQLFYLPLILMLAITISAAARPDRTTALVEVADRADVIFLSNLGIIIDDARDGFARVYVNEKEFQKIALCGYPVYWIPNQAREQFEKLHQATKGSANPLDAYHTYEELMAEMQAIADAHPDICQLLTAGQSVQGRELWLIKISDNVALEEDEPEFKYISTMHGDEPVGTEMMLNLINYLTTNYGVIPRITGLVDETEMHIMPLMNPDGFTLGRRSNVNGVDLNRNFPDHVSDPINTTEGREPETAAIMTFFWEHTPVMSANFHTGALVVNYPWDHDDVKGPYAATPDDAEFIVMSEAYSQHNLPMWNNYPPFYHGITNGSAWYVIDGGMQDWNYAWEGCMEVTIELSDISWPPASQLPDYWSDNQESLLSYMEECHKGVRGIVTDSSSGEPVAATVVVTGRDIPFFTDPDVGDYHRRLMPGLYSLHFEADNYEPVTVNDITVSSGDAVRADVQMTPSPVILVDEYSLLESVGNGDDVLDPGEIWALQTTLYNHGSNTFHNVSGALTSTHPAVQIIDDAYLFGDMASKALATTTVPHFRFKILSSAHCGITLDFHLDISSDEDTFEDDFSAVTGSASSSTTVDSTDVPKDIPDNDINGVYSYTNISTAGPVDGLTLHLDLTHTYIGDLWIRLTSPQGTHVVVWNQQGGSSDNIHQDFELNEFDGEEMQGDWELWVVDRAPSDSGTLDAWSLTLPVYECNPYEDLFGDVNNDGVINAEDLTLLADCLAGNTTLSKAGEENADLNKDSVINVVDLVLLLIKLS